MWLQKRISVLTRGRGTYDVTNEIANVLTESGIVTGLCHIFIEHTSASLIITENADPDVRRDLETYMTGLVTDGDHRFLHRDEGSDDMSAHVRNVLTATELTLPVGNGRLVLGTWQGVYVWEHRYASYRRRLCITLNGE